MANSPTISLSGNPPLVSLDTKLRGILSMLKIYIEIRQICLLRKFI